MTREEKYDLVNNCETLNKLADAILEISDHNMDIQGKTRYFDGSKMAGYCRNYEKYPRNILTREFGIRQQAIYILGV